MRGSGPNLKLRGNSSVGGIAEDKVMQSKFIFSSTFYSQYKQSSSNEVSAREVYIIDLIAMT